MDAFTALQYEQLRKLGDHPIRLEPGDSPHVRLADGTQLCADGAGRYDLWNSRGSKLLRTDLTAAEAKRLIGGAP
jgi:hypothetical protein